MDATPVQWATNRETAATKKTDCSPTVVLCLGDPSSEQTVLILAGQEEETPHRSFFQCFRVVAGLWSSPGLWLSGLLEVGGLFRVVAGDHGRYYREPLIDSWQISADRLIRTTSPSSKRG